MPRYYATGVAPKIGPQTVFVDSTTGVEMVVTDLFLASLEGTLTGRRGQRTSPVTAETRANMSAAAKARAAKKKAAAKPSPP